jgi:decaprenylphospho-beta-D-erythro-pentofuranosid-2-ulose 2-reductase
MRPGATAPTRSFLMKDATNRYGNVLVLGGGSEIAQATLLELAREGPFRAVLAARDASRVETTRLAAAGIRTEHIAFDALRPDLHDGLIATICGGADDVDLVLITFGVLGGGGGEDAANAFEIAATNFAGAVSLLTALASRLRAQGRGEIVVLSSVAAQRARRSNYLYGSSKAGLDAFVDGLRLELAGSGVRLLLVRPGFVTTKMSAGLRPAPFSVEPERVGAAIVEALRTGRESIWVPRVLRPIMLLLRLAPRALMQRL